MNASRVLAIVEVFALCPSVTLRYCVKQTQARIFILGCPKDSSLSSQNFMPLGEGVSFE